MGGAVSAIDPPTTCPQCCAPFIAASDQCETTVGYFSPDGHEHDDNCLTQAFRCANGHTVRGSIQRSCSTVGCDWKGKRDCCGYDRGPKWTYWPLVASEGDP